MGVLMLKKLGIVLFAIILVLSLFADALWIYYKIWGEDKLPQTIDSIYINAYEGEDGEKLAKFNINYFDNSKGNGTPMLEFSVDGYTDVEMQASATIGLQVVGNNFTYERLTEDNCTELFANQYVNPYVNYYEMRDGQSYPATARLTREYPLLVDVNGELFELKLNKKYRAGGTDWIFFKTDYYGYYTWSDLVSKMLDVSKTLPEGISYQRINLAEYFTVYKYDTSTNQFHNVDDSNYFFTEVVFKIQKSTQGMTRARDSIFDMINYDRNYGESSLVDDYWQASMVRSLTLADFEKRESKVDGGYLLSLSSSMKEFFNNNKNIYAHIDLVLTPQDSIVGLDFGGLKDVHISSFSISAYIEQNFVIKANALDNTYYSIENIKTSNITIVGGEL